MNKEGMEIARGFKDAAIIENLQRAKNTAQAIQRNAIGEFIRFKNTVFAISGIESAQRFEPTETKDFRDKEIYTVEVVLKPSSQSAVGRKFRFEKCTAEEFETFSEKLGA